MPNKRYNFFRGKKKPREKCLDTDSSDKSENDLDHLLITADDEAILPRVNLANSQVKSIKSKWIKKTEEDKINLPGTDTKRSNNQATAGKAAMVLTVKQERVREDVSGQAKASSATASPVSNEDMANATAVKLPIQHVITADEKIVQAKGDTATNDIYKVTPTSLLDTTSSAPIAPYVQQVESPTDVANSIRTRDKIPDQEIEPTLGKLDCFNKDNQELQRKKQSHQAKRHSQAKSSSTTQLHLLHATEQQPS